ncbi:hypothetical protein L3Q82_005515 [Scortum barcoo]|uniref:Uncharacterized protein n=1 Tax=Scortum barcoo TaxID=214431 RepID=A0ACB8VAH6_9TELE|nr:hypothetical protein L3Q82_005515 [Scortum barcoo]
MKLIRVTFLWILAQTVSENKTTQTNNLRSASTMNGTLPTLLTLLTLLSLSKVAEGESRAVCPNPTVEAVEGDSVSLLCRLDPPDSVVNNAVDWKKVDLNTVVYAYRNKKENQKDQVAEYRGRANVSLEGLNAGNMTLWISSVKTSDSGPYRCFTSKLRTSCNVSLTVVPKAQQNGTKREDFSTTAPPTHVDEPGAENVKHDRHIISTIVGVSIFVVIIIVVVLVRRGTILKYASVVLDVHISVGKTLLAESVESFRAGLTCSYSSRTSPTIEAFLPGMCCLIQHLHKETKRDILHNRNRLQVSNNHLNQALCDVSGSLGVI